MRVASVDHHSVVIAYGAGNSHAPIEIVVFLQLSIGKSKF